MIYLKTVEKHRQHLMRKLDLHDTAGLTRYETVLFGKVNEDFTDWESVAAEYAAPEQDTVENFVARLERIQANAAAMSEVHDADA